MESGHNALTAAEPPGVGPRPLIIKKPVYRLDVAIPEKAICSENTTAMPILKRQKTEKALQYRWGIVGAILVAGLLGWYFSKNVLRFSGTGPGAPEQGKEWLPGYVKIRCPRCGDEPGKRENCSLCNGHGFVWMDKTREDIPEEIKLTE